MASKVGYGRRRVKKMPGQLRERQPMRLVRAAFFVLALLGQGFAGAAPALAGNFELVLHAPVKNQTELSPNYGTLFRRPRCVIRLMRKRMIKM